MKVRLTTNLGDADRIANGLEDHKGMEGDVVDIKKEYAEALKAQSWAEEADKSK